MFSVARVIDEVIEQQNATRRYVLVQECQCLNSACRITELFVMMIMPVTLQQARGACRELLKVLNMHVTKHSCHHSLKDFVSANGLMGVLMQAYSVTLCIGHVM